MMTPDELARIVRDALLELGGQTYVDTYAQEVKAQKGARHGAKPEGHAS
jgi:hypothetical protein